MNKPSIPELQINHPLASGLAWIVCPGPSPAGGLELVHRAAATLAGPASFAAAGPFGMTLGGGGSATWPCPDLGAGPWTVAIVARDPGGPTAAGSLELLGGSPALSAEPQGYRPGDGFVHLWVAGYAAEGCSFGRDGQAIGAGPGAVLAISGGAGGVIAGPGPSLTNPGFEDGLAGWQAVGEAYAVGAGGNNPTTPDGSTLLQIKNQDHAEQVVGGWPGGAARVRLLAGRYVYGAQPVLSVLLDGAEVASFTPTNSAALDQVVTPTFQATQGTHTLRFAGGVGGAGAICFVDAVAIEVDTPRPSGPGGVLVHADGTVDLAAIWARALSPGELAALRSDPFALVTHVDPPPPDVTTATPSEVERATRAALDAAGATSNHDPGPLARVEMPAVPINAAGRLAPIPAAYIPRPWGGGRR